MNIISNNKNNQENENNQEKKNDYWKDDQLEELTIKYQNRELIIKIKIIIKPITVRILIFAQKHKYVTKK